MNDGGNLANSVRWLVVAVLAIFTWIGCNLYSSVSDALRPSRPFVPQVAPVATVPAVAPLVYPTRDVRAENEAAAELQRSYDRHNNPASDSGAPAGATAQCADGTYSFSANRRGTCSHHGGVARWL